MIWEEVRRKQVNVASEERRVANQGIFAPVGMAIKVGPYRETGSQVHKV